MIGGSDQPCRWAGVGCARAAFGLPRAVGLGYPVRILDLIRRTASAQVALPFLRMVVLGLVPRRQALRFAHRFAASGLDRPAGPSRMGFHVQCKSLRTSGQDATRDLSDGSHPNFHSLFDIN